MVLNRTVRFCVAVLSFGFPLLWASKPTKEATHRQVVSIPAEGLEASEMLLVANQSRSLVFLNMPKNKMVQIVEVTDSSRPVALRNFNYGAQDRGEPFHLIEHYSALLDFASAGKDRTDRPHTISLVDLSSKIARHGAASVKSLCDYIIDPHRAVTYALGEHNLTVIRTSDDDDAGERVWESTLAP